MDLQDLKVRAFDLIRFIETAKTELNIINNKINELEKKLNNKKELSKENKKEQK